MSMEQMLSYIEEEKYPGNYKWGRDGFIAIGAIKAEILDWKQATKTSYEKLGRLIGCSGERVRYYVTKPKARNIDFADLCLFFIYAEIPFERFIIIRFSKHEIVNGKFVWEKVEFDILGNRR